MQEYESTVHNSLPWVNWLEGTHGELKNAGLGLELGGMIFKKYELS